MCKFCERDRSAINYQESRIVWPCMPILKGTCLPRKSRQSYALSSIVSILAKVRWTKLALMFDHPDSFLLYSHKTRNIILNNGTGNKCRLLDVNRIVEYIGKDVCDIIPYIHCLTGWDTTSAFGYFSLTFSLPIGITMGDVLQTIFYHNWIV